MQLPPNTLLLKTLIRSEFLLGPADKAMVGVWRRLNAFWLQNGSKP